jgi:hypothetical protein
MCGTIDPGSCIRWVLSFGIKTGYDRFWGSTKKPALLISMCMVHTAHDVTRPPDHPATEYPTYATILGPLYQVSYSCHDSHHCPSCRTYQLHTTRQVNAILHMNKDKGKITEMSRIRIQTSASQWLITIKPRNWPLGFSISPLMSLLTIQSTKFEVQIYDPTKHS